MHKKFEINLTNIKGSCQSGWKVVPHDSKSDLPQVQTKILVKIHHCHLRDLEKVVPIQRCWSSNSAISVKKLPLIFLLYIYYSNRVIFYQLNFILLYVHNESTQLLLPYEKKTCPPLPYHMEKCIWERCMKYSKRGSQRIFSLDYTFNEILEDFYLLR